MEKKKLIVLLLLLTGCTNYKQAACSLNLQDKQINIDIKAINDDISSIEVRTVFEIPYSVVNNKERFGFLCKQIDEEYHFEDNLLVKEYEVNLDKNYSYALTLEYLKNKRYFCE